uniref:Uncharacterized protein n=1 Tax=Arundo donax TaxID=35708 RepID=A0A0A9FZ58_ARUDO
MHHAYKRGSSQMQSQTTSRKLRQKMLSYDMIPFSGFTALRASV